MQVDPASREIAASVTEIAAWPPEPRPGGWLARARLDLGLKVHREYRERRAREVPGFAAEVPVRLERRVGGWRATVTGRADGVLPGPVVEEVKSTERPAPAHRFQLRLYALALGARGGRLVLPDRAIEVDCDPAWTARELDRRLGEIGARALASAERRAALAAALRFPYAPRPGQLDLVAAMEEGLARGRPVLLHAPTGTGKTVCALVAALRRALRRDAQVVFATSRTTQQALVVRTACDLGLPLRTVTLRAKARMCPPGTLLCHPEACGHLAAFLDARRREAVLGGLGGDPDGVYAAGRDAGVCPHALSLALAREADLVVGDVNYVYGPAALPLERAVVVIDEAHGLFDRAREQLSPFLDGALVAHLAERDALFAEVALLAEEGELSPDLWAPLAEEAARRTVELAARGPVPPGDPVLGALETVARIHELLALDAPELVPCATERGAGIACLDPGRFLEERHRGLLGTIAMSGTLAPIAHYRDVLGFGRLDPLVLEPPYPFPESNRRVVVVPSVETSFRARRRHHASIAATIGRVADARPGHYAAFFPSYAFLADVRAHLRRQDLLVERPGLAPFEREAILQRLRTDPHPLLLLAVAGGGFAEGVDLPGDALVGAVVVGPCLPPPDPGRTLMRRYFDATCGGGCGWLAAFAYPGLLRVLQAAGRVHRTPEDKGVIVLLDRRFAEEPFASCLPPHVVADDPLPPVEAFWREGEP